MANKIYLAPETALGPWKDTGTTYTLALNNLAAGAGRQGDTVDLGAASRSGWYDVTGRFAFATTPVVGEAVYVYIKQSDGTRIANDDGTTDGAVSAEDKLRNLRLACVAVVDEAALVVDMVCSARIYISQRHIQPVVWNGTADNLVATDDLSDVIIVPVPPEIQ